MPHSDIETDELAHEAVPLSPDPKVQVAILTERLRGFSKQLHKLDKTQGEIFSLLRDLGESIQEVKAQVKTSPGCPGTCNEFKKEVASHTKLIDKLEGAKIATFAYCSAFAFVAGMLSPYIIKIIFK